MTMLILIYYLHFVSIPSLLALINHSIHLPSISVWALPLFLNLLAFFHNFLAILISYILLTCPNHFNILLSISVIRSGIPRNSVASLLVLFLQFSCSDNSRYSRDSSVGIATGYGLDSRGIGVQVPIGANFSPFYIVQTGSGAHRVFYLIGIEDSFPGVQTAEAWNWPLTSNQYRGQEYPDLCISTPHKSSRRSA
jgi:hypothetical protein